MGVGGRIPARGLQAVRLRRYRPRPSRRSHGQGHGTEEETLALGEVFPQVLQAARGGAAWAFERLYAELAGAVLGYLRMQRAAEPEDLTSEVFLGVFRGLGSFQGSEQQFRSWVFTIAHRRLQDERRRAARRPHLAAMEVEPQTLGGDVEQEALDSLGNQWVMRISTQLSADQRTVLLLRTVADLTAEQVAQLTGKTPGAVRALQRRGLETLRRQLASQGWPAHPPQLDPCAGGADVTNDTAAAGSVQQRHPPAITPVT